MDELWKPFPEFENTYLVSSKGNVMRISSGRILKLKENVDGYNVICLSENNIKYERRVARAVATAFIRPPLSGEVVNHLDCNKQNDCVTNLEWTTISGNTKHAYDNGLITNPMSGKFGEDNYFSKEYEIILPDKTILKIKGLSDFCRKNNLTLRSMYKVLSGEMSQHKGYKVRRVV